jgi:hypothetical protein
MRAVLAMTLLTLVAELPVAAQTSRPSVAESRGGLEALIETARVSEQKDPRSHPILRECALDG